MISFCILYKTTTNVLTVQIIHGYLKTISDELWMAIYTGEGIASIPPYIVKDRCLTATWQTSNVEMAL